MTLTTETEYKTEEQWQYWGAFFDTVLYQNITLSNIHYTPRLHVTSTNRMVIDYLNANHAWKHIREVDKKAKNPNWRNLLTWEISAPDIGLEFLEPLELYLLTQGELAGKMLAFLRFKDEFRYKSRSRQEKRQEDQLVEAFFEEKKRAPAFTGKLTPSAIAGMVDGTDSIYIHRAEVRLEYTPRVVIYARAESLAKAIYQEYGGNYERYGEGETMRGGSYGYQWRGTGESATRILRASQDHIVLCKAQADLALQFSRLQPYLDKGPNAKRPTTGELAVILNEYSGPSSLIDLLREGFYSQMRRLNGR